MLYTGALQAPVGSAELVCRMLHDPSIRCGTQLASSSALPDGKLLVRMMHQTFVDIALEVIQSAGSWVCPGYLYFKVHKGYLEYFSFWMMLVFCSLQQSLL